MSAKVQRLRLSYARGHELQYVSHLDMLRFWERTLRRAHAPVAYSEGFTPHPQINLGPPLAVGQTGRAELIDVFLAEAWTPERFRDALAPQLPPGLSLARVAEAPLEEPSLQSQLRAAEYELQLQPGADLGAIEQRIAAFLAAETFPWEHVREKETRRYDLRPLVLDLRLERRADGPVLTARLRAEEGATARPDQLAAALGIAAALRHIERAALILAAPVARR
ncbi:MAG TPA: TIGR03936 family radical SAM-associated protein [Dehalococcoidia bacterium]|nr:TIGR03936 family radical SAM-associated protein [Dehalococcoidia bacterium]